MPKKFLKPSQISLLPEESGVYFFYSKYKNPIYIGKSFNLRERVKNHFNQSNSKDNFFINQVKKIGYISLNSEIEALLEEARLIKKYQPKFNVVFRDDKNYFYVGMTKEDWPRIFITHQPKLKIENCKLKIDFVGPFVGGGSLKETLKVLRKIFPYRTCKNLSKRPCLWYHLDRCFAPCLMEKEIKMNSQLFKHNEARKGEYQSIIKRIKLILTRGKEKLISNLKREMRKFSELQEFEKSAKIRDEIRSLEEVFSHKFLFQPKRDLKENTGELLRKYFSLTRVPERIEGYDISQISGKEMVGSMVVFSRISTNLKTNFHEYVPNKNEYRRFKIKTVKQQNDTACLKEVLKRRLKHSEWKFPDLIYIDGGKVQLNAARAAIRQAAGSRQATMPVIALAKKKNILYNPFSSSFVFLDKLPQAVKMLILRLRDESHRFAISYHRKLRSHLYRI